MILRWSELQISMKSLKGAGCIDLTDHMAGMPIVAEFVLEAFSAKAQWVASDRVYIDVAKSLLKLKAADADANFSPALDVLEYHFELVLARAAFDEKTIDVNGGSETINLRKASAHPELLNTLNVWAVRAGDALQRASSGGNLGETVDERVRLLCDAHVKAQATVEAVGRHELQEVRSQSQCTFDQLSPYKSENNDGLKFVASLKDAQRKKWAAVMKASSSLADDPMAPQLKNQAELLEKAPTSSTSYANDMCAPTARAPPPPFLKPYILNSGTFFQYPKSLSDIGTNRLFVDF